MNFEKVNISDTVGLTGIYGRGQESLLRSWLNRQGRSKPSHDFNLHDIVIFLSFLLSFINLYGEWERNDPKIEAGISRATILPVMVFLWYVLACVHIDPCLACMITPDWYSLIFD